MKLKDKVAVVTGTSYGLGKAIAEMLLSDGFKVYGISRTESSIKNDNFVWIKADLNSQSDLNIIKDSIKEDKVDILINNAGMAFLGSTTEFLDEDFDRIFSLNFKTPIKLTSLLLQKLEGGLVMNISSDSDRFAEKGLSLYSSTKAALNIYFDTLAVENPKLKVVSILASTMDTPLTRTLNYEDLKNESEWKNYMNPNQVAIGIVQVIKDSNKYSTKSRFIILSDYFADDAKDPEILYSYNVDTKVFKKLK